MLNCLAPFLKFLCSSGAARDWQRGSGIFEKYSEVLSGGGEKDLIAGAEVANPAAEVTDDKLLLEVRHKQLQFDNAPKKLGSVVDSDNSRKAEKINGLLR